MTIEALSPRLPDVAIILPVFNDAEWVATALDSCLAQTLGDIEIIVVDDASTDGTAEIVERYQSLDDRIQLLRQPTNQSAFQARRRGIEAATAPFVLFLDGDDELLPETAAQSFALARSEGADVVAFGCEVISPEGETGGHYENSMQPRHSELLGADILATLLPVGKTAQGQLWRYLFARDLLTAAYGSLPQTLVLPRINDLPIAFLALMRARKYVSTPSVLYRYFFRRGASGHQVATLADYQFIAGAIDSITAIAEPVSNEVASRIDGSALAATYESTRLSVIGRVLGYVCDTIDEELRATTFGLLTERVGRASLIAAAADFSPAALPLLTATSLPAQLIGAPPRHIVLRTGNLGTGGVQGVVVAQATHLTRAGFRVTISIDSAAESVFHLAEGVEVVRVVGDSRAQKISWLIAYCAEHDVDVVIDHHIFYNDHWPYFALATAEAGIATIGWLHNFALRPIVDGSTRLSFLQQYLPLLTSVIVLSEADVAYWKLRGIPHVAYLPNPPSPLLENLPAWSEPRTSPLSVLEIGSVLRDAGIPFHITVIGPDGPDLSAEQLLQLAEDRGITDHIDARGPLHGDELISAVKHAHVFVSTSAIEGYPLALVEAQALGLPLVMYDLPWLAAIKDNYGAVTVAQGDRRGAARELSALRDPEVYERLSAGSVAAARAALSHDFAALYTDLVSARLAPTWSPEPTNLNVNLLLGQQVFFTERLIHRERRAIDRARKTADTQRKKAARVNGELEHARADADNQRKNAARLSHELEEIRMHVAGKHQAAISSTPLSRPVPSVASTGVKGWLQRLLPASMRQVSFYARHQHNISTRQHDQLVNSQAAINEHLAAIATSLAASQRQVNEELGRAIDQLHAVGADIAAVNKRIRPIEDQLVSLDEKVSEQSSRISGHAARIGDMLAATQRASHVDVAQAIESLSSIEHSARTEDLRLIDDRLRELSTLSERNGTIIRRASSATDEVLWGSVFHDTIIGSKWFTDPALSPGRWAVGYPFLYVLYRVLDEVEPASVLEFGLGQSTKVVAQYARHTAGARHRVIEHDPHWIDTFAANYQLPAETHLTQLDLTHIEVPPHTAVTRYDGFAAAVANETFDLIIIDGPFGHGADLARIDVLDLLPGSLASRFAIILDDANRPGERAAAVLIVAALEEAGIAHLTKTYSGQKDVWIAVSTDLAFLTTL